MMNHKSCTTYLAGMLAGNAAAKGQPVKRQLRLLAALGGSMLIAACASTTGTDTPELTSSTASPVLSQSKAKSAAPSNVSLTDRTLINDTIRFSTQIFPPISTTLQFPQSDNDPMLQQFVNEFAIAGYGIQRVSADQGSNYFSYSKSRSTADDGESLVSLNTTIGAVSIGRDYTMPDTNIISPASPVRLSGTRVPVTVTDQPTRTFRASDDPANAAAVYIASLNLEEQAPPVISLLTDDLVDRVAGSNAQATSLQAINSNRMEVNNLFFTDQSNFTNILDGYQQIDRQIVVFGNDSMILGNTNKLLIEQMVEERLLQDDLIGLVGCSNGPTSLDIGNEGLALGRAQRVTQALLSQGVARSQILDEGCWAPVSAGDKFPSRGVVLELWRKAS